MAIPEDLRHSCPRCEVGGGRERRAAIRAGGGGVGRRLQQDVGVSSLECKAADARGRQACRLCAG
eukprot:1157087-Pelagomonas_calceolata.AAC.19